MTWNINDVEIGDFISTQIVNKKGDRNLDGCIIKGIIEELIPSHNMVRLKYGWCCHGKDILLKHIKKEKLNETKTKLTQKG